MVPLPADASVSRTEIFGTPTWRVAVPEMESFRSRLLGDIRTSWGKGHFERPCLSSENNAAVLASRE